MAKDFIKKIACILMTCIALCLVACNSDESAPEYGFMSTPNVDESIALAMAGGTYECAFELDTIQLYKQEDGVIEVVDILEIEGANFPKRGDYLEIKGDKVYSTLQFNIDTGHAILKDQIDEYMAENPDESYDSCFYLQENFSYNIINSCIFEGDWTKYIILYADANRIVIRYTNVDTGAVWDYYYKKTSPRDISQSYDDYGDAIKAIISKYKELFGEDKFNEIKKYFRGIDKY